MKRFYQSVDKRSRKAMVSFLKSHERYNTANSWNHSTSYAHNLKIYGLGIEATLADKLYDLIDTEGFYELLGYPMHDFAVVHNYQWQAAMNGRSGGYLVLYQGGTKKSEFHSYCTACGQKEFPLSQTEAMFAAFVNKVQSKIFPISQSKRSFIQGAVPIWMKISKTGRCGNYEIA